MSAAPPILFDRALLARRRAGRPGDERGAVSLGTAVAEDLADRREAVLRVFDRILVLGDTGGSLSARLAIAGPGARLVRAASLATGPDDAGAEVIVDEEALPFAPASFDLVASNLVLSGVNDLPGALIQLRRALAPDGLLLASLIGGDTLTELRQALAEAETALSGGLSPRVAPFPDVRAAASLLQRAGFALPVADVERYTVRDNPRRLELTLTLTDPATFTKPMVITKTWLHTPDVELVQGTCSQQPGKPN